MNRPQRIGFTGLGMMGAPMAECLSKAGSSCFLADADMERPRKITNELHARRLDRENASTLDVLITMLPNSNIVEAVLLGSDGDGQTNGWVAVLPKSVPRNHLNDTAPTAARAASTFIAGTTDDESTQLGPLVNRNHFDRVQRLIQSHKKNQ